MGTTAALWSQAEIPEIEVEIGAEMTKKQSSSDVSSIAAKYVRMTSTEMHGNIAGYWWNKRGRREAEQFFKDIRKLAASVLSQDERKGQGK